MKMAYDQHFSKRSVPISQPIPGKRMVKNTDGGGYAFQIGDELRFERFLILGNEGGTYYAGERDLTIQNAQCIVRLMADETRGLAALNKLTHISQEGRAPKNDPALFALAIATASENMVVRRRAWELLPQIARIGTHLFTFIQYREAMGGWGPLARKGIANWYLSKSPDQIAFQYHKYAQRNGWSHRDLLRLSHVVPPDTDVGRAQGCMFSAITHEEPAKIPQRNGERYALGVDELLKQGRLPRLFEGCVKAMAATKSSEIIELIHDYNLHREMIPTQWHNDPAVQAELLVDMPMTAMIRNLGNLSKSGLLVPMSETARLVCERLADEERLRKARVHPLSILLAQRTYASGKGKRGKGEWIVVPQVVNALEGAFLKSFKYAPKTGKRWMLGVDVSSSMTSQVGDTGISSCEMAALMALVIAKQEEQYFIGGFADRFVDLKITAADTLESAARKAQKANFGSTSLSATIGFAERNKIPVDVFMILTDNEGNRGEQPEKAVQQYRERRSIDSKIVSCAFTATEYSFGDPNEPRTLNCVGLDANVPSIVADFAVG
jgi:60 kDa SS-A/Ro ribonucleoprotein